jgi:hypothetical protein
MIEIHPNREGVLFNPPRIVFRGLPMPPSVNETLTPMRSRKSLYLVSSRVAKSFKACMEYWYWKNKDLVNESRIIIKDWKLIKLDLYCILNHRRIFTLKGEPKVFDVHNRIKPMHDAIAKHLQHDDKFIFSGDAEKLFHLDNNVQDHCTIVITPFIPREYSESLF